MLDRRRACRTAEGVPALQSCSGPCTTTSSVRRRPRQRGHRHRQDSTTVPEGELQRREIKLKVSNETDELFVDQLRQCAQRITNRRPLLDFPEPRKIAPASRSLAICSRTGSDERVRNVARLRVPLHSPERSASYPKLDYSRRGYWCTGKQSADHSITPAAAATLRRASSAGLARTLTTREITPSERSRRLRPLHLQRMSP